VVVVLLALAGGVRFAAGSTALSVTLDAPDTGTTLVLPPSGASKARIIAIAIGLSLIATLQLTSNVQFLGQRWHVVVDYNGSEKIFDYNPEWTVKVIRERAMLAFWLTQGQHPLSLFNLAGVELPDTASTEAAGIQPGDHLLLRPSKVKTGP
jgi:hypothetical protein